MQMYILSPLYVLTLAVAAGFVAALFFLFRHSAERTQRDIVILLVAINIIQHIFKHQIYPHLNGKLFGMDNTVYNFCAALICFSPFLHFSKRNSAKEFICILGTISGGIALAVPFWFFGKTLNTPALISEYIRFYLCHVLLLTSSILPALWGRVRFRFTDEWKYGLYFIFLLCVILFNNTIFLITFAGGEIDLYPALMGYNAFGIMGPPPNVPTQKLLQIAEMLSFSCFLGGNGQLYTPILWYALPLYEGITIIACILGALFDRKDFVTGNKLLFRKPLPAPERPMLPKGIGSDKQTVRLLRAAA